MGGCACPAGSAPNYRGCPRPAGSPRGYRRSGFHGNDRMQDSFLISEMPQVSITFRGGLNNKHERQQINETSRILSPAKCLFSSVFPRGSPSELEQRDFKFGKNLGNRSSRSANCHSSTEVSRDMTIYTHLGSATG